MAIPQSAIVEAGTGTRFIVLPTSGTSDVGALSYTPDTGSTWREVPAPFHDAALAAVGFGGSFVGMFSRTDGSGGVQRWDPGTGTGTGTVTDYAFDAADLALSGDNPFTVEDYVGSTVVISDGRVFDLHGHEATRVAAQFPTSSLYDPTYGLTEDAGTVVRGTYPQANANGYLTAIPLRGGGAPRTVAIANLLGMDVTGSEVHYLAGSTKGLRLCVAPASDVRRARCATLAQGDYRAKRHFGKLTISAGADQVHVGERQATQDPQQWLVQNGRSVAVSGAWWTWLPFRDTQAPMALIHSNTDQLDRAALIDPSGRPARLFGAPGGSGNPTVLALASGRVLSMKDRYLPSDGSSTVVSTRAISTDGSVGPAVDFTQPVLAAVVASAGRTAVRWDPLPGPGPKTDFYDGGTRTGSVTGGYRDALDLSGPYARVGTRVVRIDGHVYRSSPVYAMFGSLVIEASSQKEAPGRTFAVRDLAASGAPTVRIDLPQPAGRVYLNNSYIRGISSWLLAGDWVTARYIDPGDNYGWLAFNYRTRKVHELGNAESVFGLGEGWVLLGNSDEGLLRILDLTTGDNLEMSVGYDTHGVISDRINTISWAGDKSLDIVRIEGLPVTPPRLLGTMAPSTVGRGTVSWKPQFDLTKAVLAGSVEIRNHAGALVRSLPTDDSPTGSVRNVRWDGRDSAGTPVATGTYTWTLAVTAADSSGAALSVDGRHAPTGQLQVDR